MLCYITLYVNAPFHFHTFCLCKTDLYEYLIIVINYQEYLSFCISYMMSTMLSCTISTRLSFILLMRSNISVATANIKRYSRPNILYLKKSTGVNFEKKALLVHYIHSMELPLF